MSPRGPSALFVPVVVALACACGASPTKSAGVASGDREAGEASGQAREGALGAEGSGDDDGFFSLLTFPKANVAPPVPEVEDPPVNPVTSGTCVGQTSKATQKPMGEVVCCYTPPSVFIKAVRSKWDAMKACYSDALTRNPRTQGRVVSKFTIEEDGKVIGACDAGSDVGDPKLVECVLRTMTTVTFDSYPVGDPCPAVTIMYPIQFKPKQ
jgi:hypothetical protein